MSQAHCLRDWVHIREQNRTSLCPYRAYILVVLTNEHTMYQLVVSSKKKNTTGKGDGT